MKIKRILRLTLFIPLAYYIYVVQNYDSNILVRESLDNKYLSSQFSVDSIEDKLFVLTDKEWPFKNRLDNELLLLSLKFDTSINSSQSNLVFNLSAYTKGKGGIINRLILHEYVNSSNKTALKDREMPNNELPLGLVANFNYEDLIIKLHIIQSDSLIKPRLKIETYKGSSGVYGFTGLDVLFKNIVLVISIICIIIYVFIGQIRETKNDKPCR